MRGNQQACSSCRHRLDEMRTAARLLQSLAKGLPDAGLTFHDAVKDFSASLKGRLDMSCLACLGHSFGGGPSCALPAESDIFKCGIGMDPYWYNMSSASVSSAYLVT